MNYRELLIKYMALVGSCEGVYFIPNHNDYSAFSQEEIDELIKISSEADKLDLYNSLIAQR